ncbi:putative dihydrouridine synthase [Podospora australis]|uniref:Dihydrouridine synthase n=1 Tax=Podospora australis TaxID=1536484 RepID=A0AAN7AGL1_9PEZI|nr:putative dihydrouridine synthase [Podospora australis]
MATTTDTPEAVAPTTTVTPVPIPPRGVDYRGKLVLAPMVRSGELPCRLLALHYGADLVWGPETVDYSLIGTTRRINPRTGMIEWTRVPSNHLHSPSSSQQESIIYRLDPRREAGRLIFQIGTADPSRAVAAARLVAADVSGIDVNAGCPKPFSTSGGMGAALLQTPDKLVAILEALVKEIVPEFKIGISVKIRLLETPQETEVLVRRLVKTGITGLTIHCRTTPMRPRERALRGQLRMIANVCHEAGVACLVNGDVENREHMATLIKEYGVDGAMIATAAEKNSSVFLGGQKEMVNWRELVRNYLRFAMEAENKLSNTKFSLTQMVPGKEAEYKLLCSCKNYTALITTLKFEEEMGELAEKADEVLKLGKWFVAPEKAPKVNKRQLQKDQKIKEESKKRKREEGEDGEEEEGGMMKKTVAEVMAEAVGAEVPAATAAVSV